jgi:glycosyltransferase involved in cell wall biosynthesis
MIVVANACTDKTPQLVRDLSEQLTRLRMVEMERRGKGHAILEGFRQARGRFALFCDSDGATEEADILNLLRKVESGRADCVIGSRWLPDSNVPVPQPLRRRIASRIFNLAVRILFGFPYRDTQCGAKAFNRKALDVLLERVAAGGYHFDCEVLWKLNQAGLKVIEVPITWRDQGGSGIRAGRDGIRMLTELIRIRFHS